MNRYTIGNYTRISKAAARKMYYNGEDIVLCACKMRPGAPWYPEAIINKNMDIAPFNEFQKVVNNFEWYNCSTETGRYTAYYKIEKAATT